VLRRLTIAAVLAAALVVTALQLPRDGDRDGDLASLYNQARAMKGLPHTSDPARPRLDQYADVATKNAISRAGSSSRATQDPTTAAERRQGAAYVATQRRLADPRLTTAPATYRAPDRPATRYAMANGCYRVAGERLFFKPTDLGTYLLYSVDREFLSGAHATVSFAAEPSADTEWIVERSGFGFTFRIDDDRHLAIEDGELVVADRGSTFVLDGTSGCAAYPEAQIDITGAPAAGVSPFQEVRGYVDAHTHGMAFEFLGGGVHCGRPWHEYGAPYALVDCPDHTATGGNGAALEALLSGRPTHDPVGWPTFEDWPAPESLTHEGTYYRSLERSWRGGQRIFVNLLVENNQLCQLYPIKHNSCDDMDSVRLQAKDMYAMQDYIDAQWGGPGRGFYRIVRSPWEARRVINDGKLAVIMGIETSVPFGCSFKRRPGGDTVECDPASIDTQLDEVHRMGVRQMELVNKFDNALAGVAGDNGEVGVAVNAANFLETNSFWDMRHCEPAHPDAHDKTQLAAPDISSGQQDALFGALAELFGTVNLPALPLYGTPDHCNARGLTTLGEHTIAGLAKRHMLFDPDHMSVKARNAALDQVEELGYPGVMSSHSWSTEDAYPRIYELGGYIAPYAGDSTGFVEKWRKHVGWADPRFYFGFGYGADMNGLGAQGNPRGADVPNPVEYPFTGLGGVTVGQQRAGERVYDINVDGVAQYGLYPDWIEDLRQVAGGADGAAIVDDMARGAEAYLQTWERAAGIAPDSCRNPGLRKRVARFESLIHRGVTTKAVLEAVGQPYTRLGNRYTFCARTAAKKRVEMTVRVSDAGRVTGVRRS
jgi:hypothetical protein